MPNHRTLRESLDASIAQFKTDHGAYPDKILVGEGSPEAVLLASVLAQDSLAAYRYQYQEVDPETEEPVDASLDILVTEAVATNPPFNTPTVTRSGGTDGSGKVDADIRYAEVAQVYLCSSDDSIQEACIPYERV